MFANALFVVSGFVCVCNGSSGLCLWCTCLTVRPRTIFMLDMTIKSILFCEISVQHESTILSTRILYSNYTECTLTPNQEPFRPNHSPLLQVFSCAVGLCLPQVSQTTWLTWVWRAWAQTRTRAATLRTNCVRSPPCPPPQTSWAPRAPRQQLLLPSCPNSWPLMPSWLPVHQ